MRRLIRSLLCLCLLAALAAGFWLFENNTVQTEVLSVRSASIPAAFDGFRIAVISDLHGREFGAGNARLLDAVSAVQPDIIALDGDIVDEKSSLELLPPLCEGLVEIAPTFYVTGNHEWRIDHLSGVLDLISSCGVTVLANDYRTLSMGDDTILLAGVHDPNGPSDMITPAELTERLRTSHPDSYLVVMNHRNDALELWSELGADLVLSGHGHGGVIRIPGIGGLVSTDRTLFPEYDAGLFTLGGTTMAVSRGLGYTGPHIRLFNRPELMVIELHTEDTP